MTTKFIYLILAVIGIAGMGNAVDICMQFGSSPGFDEYTREYKDSNQRSTYELDADTSIKVGLIMTWTEPAGASLLRGIEMNYRKEGGTNDYGDQLKTTQYTLGGRLGLGWVMTTGVTIEAGGRAMIGYAETENVEGSYIGSVANILILYTNNDSAHGLSYQIGGFIGINCRSERGFLIGIELGYEYTCARLETDSADYVFSGIGGTLGLNVGYSF